MKTIDWNTGLMARAIFMQGAHHYKLAAEYERALSETLGLDDEGYCGHLSDAMIDGELEQFDRALKKQGFAIAPRRRRKRK